MELLKVKVLEDNVDNVFLEVWINPTMIGAVMVSPRKGLTRIVMSGGQILDVEEDIENILARLRLVT